MTYMNNIDALVFALLALNTFQFYLVSSNTVHSNIYVWSLLGSSLLPLSIVYINLLQHICPMKVREISAHASRIIHKIFCCCTNAATMQWEREISDNEIPDPDRMVHPNDYPGGAIKQFWRWRIAAQPKVLTSLCIVILWLIVDTASVIIDMYLSLMILDVLANRADAA